MMVAPVSDTPSLFDSSDDTRDDSDRVAHAGTVFDTFPHWLHCPRDTIPVSPISLGSRHISPLLDSLLSLLSLSLLCLLCWLQSEDFPYWFRFVEQLLWQQWSNDHCSF